VNLKVTSGPAIEKPGEMAAILNNLQEHDVLFVDEIHRLNRQVEEVLYPAGLPEQRLAPSSRQAIRSIPPTQTILPMLTCL
jgi:hypothetical protein